MSDSLKRNPAVYGGSINSLESFIKTSPGMSETDGMNLLQDRGLVSDNALWARDVAECDCPPAIEFLLKHQSEL